MKRASQTKGTVVCDAQATAGQREPHQRWGMKLDGGRRTAGLEWPKSGRGNGKLQRDVVVTYA